MAISHEQLLKFVQVGISYSGGDLSADSYFRVARAIFREDRAQLKEALDENIFFSPDQEMLDFIQKHDPDALPIVEKHARRIKSTQVSSTVDLQKMTNDFQRLSISALEEINNLYSGTNSSSAEAAMFQKIFEERKQEEEQVRKAIDLTKVESNTGFLLPYLPLRPSAFRYLVETTSESQMVSRYLAYLYALCEPDALNLSEALEYYSILESMVDPQPAYQVITPESFRFALWQNSSRQFVKKMAENDKIELVEAYCRINPSSRKTILNQVKASSIKEKILSQLQEADLAKLSKTCTDVSDLMTFGIRSKAEITQIEKGNEIFEIWRSSLPDKSSIVEH